MSVFEIISFFAGISGIIAIFIVLWDHIKDDRQLTKRVQKFYELIESFIYFCFKRQKILILVREDPKREEKFKEKFSKISDKIYFISTFIEQNFEKYSEYLGIVFEKEDKEYFRIYNSSPYEIQLWGYDINKTELKFHSEINQFLRKSKKITENVLKMKRSEILHIYFFLDSLRNYWDENFHKRIFRPKLKQKIDFYKLISENLKD